MPGTSGTEAAEGVPATRARRALGNVRAAFRRADELTASIPTWTVLLPLVGLGWLVVLFVARAAVHTGVVYFNGGDGTWYYTTAWVLGHGQLPITSIGYGYTFLLAPFARIAGPNIIDGLPYVIVLNTVVLAPIALLCVYGIAKLIAGRRFAYAVSLLWVLAPLLAIPYFHPDYHRRYVGLTLPGVLGLTTLGDFPSMVAVLVSAYFCLRAILGGRRIDALTSGLAAGLAIAVKPSNAPFVAALVLGLAAARRWRAILATAGGLVPPIVCLVAWKARGLGNLPLISAQGRPYALGAGAPPLGLSIDIHRYLPFHWSLLRKNFDGLHEFTWNSALIEWSIVVGVVALARRSIGGAVMVSVWLASYVVLKGGTIATFDGGSFFKYLAPGFPAAFLLVASIPLLVPFAGGRLAAAGDLGTWPASERARLRVLGVGAFLGLAPLVPILALPLQKKPIAVTVPFASLFVPADAFGVAAAVHGRTVRLSWPAETSGGARVQYEVFRGPGDLLYCTPPSGGSLHCDYPDNPTDEVYRTRFVDRPGRGTWTYRVAVSSGVPPPSGMGDAILLSRPVTVTVG